MTRRQWMWLWIWLLLFFIIFCVWNKLQSMQNDQSNIAAPVVIIPQTGNEDDTGQKVSEKKEISVEKDISVKIIKDGDLLKLSGVFPSQEAVDEAIEALKSVTNNVEKGTIIIDKSADNPKVRAAIHELAKDLANFKSGYIEYNEKTITAEGIVEDAKIKEHIAVTAAAIDNTYILHNQVMIETPATETTEVSAAKEEEKAPLQETIETEKQIDKAMKLQQAQKELDEILKHKRVEFLYAKDQLTKKSRAIINQVYEILKKYPDIRIEIAGHTDSDGTKANNLRLSQRRADAIKRYLIKKGIDAKRLIAKGYGESKPLVKNDTAAHKQINRRVEFKVITK